MEGTDYKIWCIFDAYLAINSNKNVPVCQTRTKVTSIFKESQCNLTSINRIVHSESTIMLTRIWVLFPSVSIKIPSYQYGQTNDKEKTS